MTRTCVTIWILALILTVMTVGPVLADEPAPPTLVPTATPRTPQLGLYLKPPSNGQTHGPGEIFSLVMSLSNSEPMDQEVNLVSVFALDGLPPYWVPSQEPVQLIVPAMDVLMSDLVTANLPPAFPDARGSFHAALLSDDSDVLAWETVDFALHAPPPTPTPTWAPEPTEPPTPPPSGNSHQGYRSGYAEVLVENLPGQPLEDKSVIFCLGANQGSNWVNVRHRAYHGSTFQLKGGLHTDVYDCQGETHVFDSQPAGSGIWQVWWNSSAHTIRVLSPVGGDATIWIDGGTFAFNHVYAKANCGGYIPWGTTAQVTVLTFNGEDYGPASNCGG